VLAVAYMYLVTLLAFGMARYPQNKLYPLLLANAKLASSIVSFGLYAASQRYLIYMANGIVDGVIAVIVLVMYLRLPKRETSFKLRLMNLWIPGHVKKNKLQELARITAEAFQTAVPDLQDITFAKALNKYAEFTRDAAQKAIQQGHDLGSIEQTLYAGAFRMGQDLRQELKIRTSDTAMRASTIIYRAIGMDFREESHENIVIRRCFFSDFYTSEICKIVSSLDQGLVAGFTDGGNLSFHERITDGSKYCRASLLKSETEQ